MAAASKSRMANLRRDKARRLPGRHLPVRDVMAERGARLNVEDAIQFVQQRRAQNVHQLGAVFANDRVQASSTNAQFGRK
jgi:hypothetical protein